MNSLPRIRDFKTGSEALNQEKKGFNKADKVMPLWRPFGPITDNKNMFQKERNRVGYPLNYICHSILRPELDWNRVRDLYLWTIFFICIGMYFIPHLEFKLILFDWNKWILLHAFNKMDKVSVNSLKVGWWLCDRDSKSRENQT